MLYDTFGGQVKETYMVLLLISVKVEIGEGGTEKTDYRHRSQTGCV